MVLLNALRCELCGDEIGGTNWRDVCNKAIELNWLVPMIYADRMTEDPVVCGKHTYFDYEEWGLRIKAGAIPHWEAGCASCDWADDFLTEESARKAKSYHSCDDYRDSFSDTYVKSPQQIKEEREQAEEAREKYRVQREKEAAEKERKQKEVQDQRDLHQGYYEQVVALHQGRASRAAYTDEFKALTLGAIRAVHRHVKRNK